MNSGIYIIVNQANGKGYVGSSYRLKIRLDQHLQALRKGNHRNDILQKAWNRHGEGQFTCEILEYCPAEDMIEREIWWISLLESDTRSHGYNICVPGQGARGVVRTPETRAKIAAKAALRIGAANPFYGRKHSPEASRKMSAARIGNKNAAGHRPSLETKAKISAAKIGRKDSSETRAKKSAARMGEKNPFKGKTHSPETMAKIAATKKQKKHLLGMDGPPEESPANHK